MTIQAYVRPRKSLYLFAWRYDSHKQGMPQFILDSQCPDILGQVIALLRDNPQTTKKIGDNTPSSPF